VSRRRSAAAPLGWSLFLALLVWLAAARAQAATVLIVRPAAPSAAAAETLSRLHGELLAVGLAVAVVERPAAAGGTNPRAWLERLATERGLDAALEIIDGTPQPAVDVWIFSREPPREQVTNVMAEPSAGNTVERLAIRSVDVLRSILIESHLNEATPREPAPPATVVHTATSAGAGPHGRLGLSLGAALLTSFAGGTTAVAPLARVEWAAGTMLALQVEAAGLGTHPQITTSGGSAQVAQQYALAGLCACAPAPQRLRPTLALSAGVLHTSAEGRAELPAQGHTVTQWSLLLQASLGARLAFLERYELSLTAHAQLAQPYVAVYAGDATATTLGRPTFVLTLALGGWR